MLRVRRPALARSKLSLVYPAAGEHRVSSPILRARSPSYPRWAATASPAQRRWFRQSSSRTADWERHYGGEVDPGEAEQSEVRESFERAHALSDPSPESAGSADGQTAESAGSPDGQTTEDDSIEAALRKVADSQSASSKPSKKRGSKTRQLSLVEALRELNASRVAKAASNEDIPENETDATNEEAGSQGQSQAKENAEKPPAAGVKKKKKKKDSKDPRSGTKRRHSKGEEWEVNSIDAASLELKPVAHSPDTVPSLSYNLDRCLFKPGVYPIQDTRSRVFNFDPYLATIMPINEFDYSALRGFVTSSNDPKLIEHAAKHKKKYSGSTSSLSSMLSHFHFLLSAWRPINASHTSKGFALDSTNFTAITRSPAATFLRQRNGIYAVDADKQFDTANILSMLGRSMEKLLTLPKEEYEMFRRSKSHKLTDKQKNSDNSFHYTTLGDFIMRSQLDAHDSRLPGEGMFDIKTRAVLSVRMDAEGYEKGKDYQIRSKFGQFESFEREYYDMIRSAFLKYSLQARMGRMDGIFVAYHNTERIFGFQYFPLEELDHALHGSNTTYLGDQEFKLSVHLLNQLLDRAVERFPNEPLRLHIEARPTNPPLLYFFAKPVSEEKIEKAQNVPKAEVEKWEKELTGYAEREREAAAEEEGGSEEVEDDAKDVEAPSLSVAEMNQKAEEAVENEELGKEYVRRSIEEALQRSGLVEGKTQDEVQSDVDTLLEMLTDGADTPGEEASGIALEERDEMDASGKELEQQAPAEAAGPSSDTGRESLAKSAEQEGDVETGVEGRSAESDLNDLILSLIKQREGEEVSDEAASGDANSKLGKFRQVLSELLSESRKEQDEAETPPTPGWRDAPTEFSKLESEFMGPEAYIDLEEDDRLLGMVLTIRNKVDGKYVSRPLNLTPNKKWEVEYSIQTMNKERADKLYKQVKRRRKTALESDAINRDRSWHRMFGAALPKLSKKGKEFKRMEELRAMGQPVWVVGEKEQKDWYELFGKQV